MTAVETLREAARLMRERAEGATPGPWMATVRGVVKGDDEYEPVAPWSGDYGRPTMPNRMHIASWHPAVALAVADWLDAQALIGEDDGSPRAALAVARAYLGQTS